MVNANWTRERTTTSACSSSLNVCGRVSSNHTAAGRPSPDCTPISLRYDLGRPELAMTIVDLILFIASVLAGAIAAISGFGIGSVLTPVVATRIDTKLAVAVVSIPHFVGTFLRFLRLRRYIDRSLALSFGVASAVGGL